jgi:hypothetical protein
MSEVAKNTDLSFQKHLLKYGVLKGVYKGFETEIGVYADTDAFGGIGTLLTSVSGWGSFSALNIRNFTGIKIKHSLGSWQNKVISENPLIIINKDEIYLMLPTVLTDAKKIEKNLNKLCQTIESLSKQN